MKIQLKRSNVLQSGAAKEPTASQLEYGELAINYNNSDPAIFLKDSNNNIIRISGVGNIADDGLTNVPAGTTPPTSPTPESGNLWYNSDEGRLYIYYVDANTSQWVDASPDSWDPTVMPVTTNPAAQTGTLDDRYVMENGDTMTGALLLDNAASASAPDLSFDGDANTGIYSPGADQFGITTGGTAALTVDSSQRVGIGTAAPQRPLHVNGTEGVVRLTSTASGNDGFEVGVGTSSQAFLWNTENSEIQFATNNTERMRIDSSGNVGIGTTSIDASFHVKGAGTHGSFVLEAGGSSGSSNQIYIQGHNNAGTAIGEISFDETAVNQGGLTFKTNGGTLTTKMTLTSAGALGIGTTTVSRTLHVKGNGSAGTQIQVEGTLDSAGIKLVPVSGNQYEIQANTAGSFFVYDRTNAAYRMLIDSSGNVGIGTSLPTHRLTLGTVTPASTATPETISLGGTFSNTAGANPKLRIWTDGSTIMGIGVSSNQIDYITNSTYSHVFYSNSTERMRIDGTNGALKLMAGCPGIDFSARQGAPVGGSSFSETLDHYETGTFTPTLACFNSNTQLSTFAPIATTYKGRYMRVGDRVFFTIYTRYNTSAGEPAGTNQIRIVGLPFVNGQTSQQYDPIYVGYLSGLYSFTGSGSFPGGYIHDGRAELVLTINGIGGSEIKPTLSGASSAGIMCGGSYSVNNY